MLKIEKSRFLKVGIAIFGALILFIVSITAYASEAEKSNNKSSKSFGDFYQVSVKTNGKISVIPLIKSKKDLKNYKSDCDNNFDEILNKDISADFIATVTLNNPILVEDFEDMVEKYDLDINNFKLRAHNDSNDKITIGGIPSHQELIPQNRLDEIENEENEEGGKTEIDGIIAFTCKVNKNSVEGIQNLRNDENVYAISADSYTIQNQIYSDIKNNKNSYNVSSKISSKNMNNAAIVNDVYWYVEKYNN